MLMKMGFMLVFYMLSVGFYIVLEQKLLGYMNNRFGPNKILILGVFQFFSDLIKLLLKDNIYLFIFNNYMFLIFNVFYVSLSLMVWVFFPLCVNLFNMKFMLILLMMFLMHKILLFIILIWSLNSFYSILSLIRLFIQNISFEILFFILLFYLMFLFKSFNLILLGDLFYMNMVILFSLFVFYLWMIVILIELNRVPFDFLESESELISGANLEFMSINFMFLFLIEYLDMIFMSIISLVMFINLDLMVYKFFIYLIFFLLFLLLFRGFMVRFRVDKMLYLLWKFFFPLMFNYIIFMIFLKV